METRLRASVYARVSTRDKQEVENQLVQLREFCLTQKWDLKTEYVDKESGSTGDREQFKQMLLDAAQRKFDVLVFFALDRLTREGAYQTLRYLQQLDSYGVAFRSLTEPYLDSCGVFKDAVISILATIAKQERIRISERVRAGIEQARANGVVFGKPKVEFDEVKARELVGSIGLRPAAKELGLNYETLRRRLV